MGVRMSAGKILLVSAAVVGVSLASLPSVAAAVGPATALSCTAAPLPNPPGESGSSAIGINDSGTVIGSTSGAEFLAHGAMWQNGVATDLGHFLPSAINQEGLIAGTEQGSDGFDHAMVLSNGVLAPLPEDGGQGSQATAIDDYGDIVGSLSIDGAEHAALWPVAQPGTVILLDTSTARTTAIGVDDDGFIIGVDNGASPTSFIWRTDGTLVRSYDPTSGLELLAVSAGQVAAQQFVAATSQVVVIDAQSGAVTPVPQSADGRPNAISIDGTIVGAIPAGMVGFTPTIWRDGNALALPALPNATPQHALGISPNGRYVVGDSNGATPVATVWTCC